MLFEILIMVLFTAVCFFSTLYIIYVVLPLVHDVRVPHSCYYGVRGTRVILVPRRRTAARARYANALADTDCCIPNTPLSEDSTLPAKPCLLPSVHPCEEELARAQYALEEIEQVRMTQARYWLSLLAEPGPEPTLLDTAPDEHDPGLYLSNRDRNQDRRHQHYSKRDYQHPAGPHRNKKRSGHRRIKAVISEQPASINMQVDLYRLQHMDWINYYEEESAHAMA